MSKLRRTIIETLVPMLLMSVGVRYVYGSGTTGVHGDDGVSVNTTDVLNTDQTQIQTTYGPGYSNANANASTGDSVSVGIGGNANAEGGDSDAVSYSGGSNSGAIANISTTSISKPVYKVPPLSVVPPYLPYWNHGGWGTIKAYFPNGPSSHDLVYERVFDPSDADDMNQIRKVLKALPYSNPINLLGGVFNGVRAVFGGPDYFHRGRGFEIANALIRERRPDGKPLLVFIDSNISRELLQGAGYAYVGRISLEGDVNRNWDQVYDAAIADALPWDVDILLISGGMKGVTVGSNLSFPGAAGAYSQVNYSLSLIGAVSRGITEGKGKAMVSAEGYRYWPEALIKRRIPKALYDRIHAKPVAKEGNAAVPQAQPTAAKQKQAGVKVSRELFDLAGFDEGQRVQNMIIQ